MHRLKKWPQLRLPFEESGSDHRSSEPVRFVSTVLGQATKTNPEEDVLAKALMLAFRSPLAGCPTAQKGGLEVTCFRFQFRSTQPLAACIRKLQR